MKNFTITNDHIDTNMAIILLNDLKENVRSLSPAHIHALDLAIEALKNQVYVSPMVRKYGRD